MTLPAISACELIHDLPVYFSAERPRRFSDQEMNEGAAAFSSAAGPDIIRALTEGYNVMLDLPKNKVYEAFVRGSRANEEMVLKATGDNSESLLPKQFTDFLKCLKSSKLHELNLAELWVDDERVEIGHGERYQWVCWKDETGVVRSRAGKTTVSMVRVLKWPSLQRWMALSIQ